MTEREDYSSEERRQIASLTNHPGYHFLLDYLDHHLQQLLESMETEKSPMELVAKAREWQFLTKVVKTLRYTPQSMQEELALTTNLYVRDEIFQTNVPSELQAMAYTNQRIRERLSEGESE